VRPAVCVSTLAGAEEDLARPPALFSSSLLRKPERQLWIASLSILLHGLANKLRHWHPSPEGFGTQPLVLLRTEAYRHPLRPG